MPVQYVNAIIHPDHGLLYLSVDTASNFPIWVPNLGHAKFSSAPKRIYASIPIPVTISKKRLLEVSASKDLEPHECAPWTWRIPPDDMKTRAAHKKNLERIKSEAWRRPPQRKDITVYISIASLTSKMECTTNPLIARKLWGDQIIEGTLIRSLITD